MRVARRLLIRPSMIDASSAIHSLSSVQLLGAPMTIKCRESQTSIATSVARVDEPRQLVERALADHELARAGRPALLAPRDRPDPPDSRSPNERERFVQNTRPIVDSRQPAGVDLDKAAGGRVAIARSLVTTLTRAPLGACAAPGTPAPPRSRAARS
jgi:hypothetical protein